MKISTQAKRESTKGRKEKGTVERRRKIQRISKAHEKRKGKRKVKVNLGKKKL